METKIKKFQFIMIDEKRTHLIYPGVEEKGPRPFLVVRSDLYGNFFLACPVTDRETADKWIKEKRKSYLLINTFGEENYVKMNFPVVFSKALIKEGIAIPIDKHLNKSLRNVSMRLLKEAFDD